MGSCQSQAVDRREMAGGGNRPCDPPGKLSQANKVPPTGTETPARNEGGMSRVFGGKKSSQTSKIPAYELALMTSPSERTNVTQAMTPMSSSAKSIHVDGEEDGDDDVSELDVPFDEEFEGMDEKEVPFDEEGNEIESMDDDEEWSPAAVRSLSLSSNILNTPRHLSTSSVATPSTSKKKRMGLFTLGSKKTPAVSVESPVLVKIQDDDDDDDGASKQLESPEHVLPTRKVPLVAPPKGVDVEFDATSNPTQQPSVNPKTLACFNKMKIQAQQAESLEQKKKQQEKIKDRRKDIQGYNDLWDEYSAIQEKVSQQQCETMSSEEIGATTVPISIQDTTNWFIDFSSLNEVTSRFSLGDDDDEEEDDARSQSSLSLHSETSERAQRALFKEKARKRRVSSMAAKALTGDDNSYDGSNIDGGRRSSVTLNDNHSVISDFSSDMGSNGVPDKSDDYGVLSKYRHKSIEQSVMEYSDYLEATPRQYNELENGADLKSPLIVDASIREEVQDHEFIYEDAPTPKTVNNKTSSIEAYLEEMSLPSVCIENAETGIVRWREFPKSEERAKTARKLDFPVEDHQVDSTQFYSLSKANGLSEEEYSDSKIEPREVVVDTKKTKIKTYHPVISSMSKEDFYRVSSSRSVASNFKAETTSCTRNLEAISTHETPLSSIVADGNDVTTDSRHQELKAHRDLLARKVGTKLAALVAQLKENGLGE